MKQIEINQDYVLESLLLGALEGKHAHVHPENVLDGLSLSYTGKKILNTPYTIWQCLKHINYWQAKFLRRLQGEMVEADHSWKEGWEEKLNACCQEELDAEVEYFRESMRKVKEHLQQRSAECYEPSGMYPNKFAVVQTMASHISYHIGEIVLLRRIFGAWPPKSGGMVW